MDSEMFSLYSKRLEDEAWSRWYKLEEGFSHQDISSGEGLYRVGVMDADRRLLWLTYVGQTGRSLHERLGTLRRRVYDVLKPGDTPHVAAPAHWDFRHSFLDGQHFECSVFELPGMEEEDDRKSLESLAITFWRQKRGLYPLVNFGSITSRTVQERLDFLRASLVTIPLIDLGKNVISQEQNDLLDRYWLGLPWSDWLPATASQKMEQRGIYRVCGKGELLLTKVGFGILQNGLSEYRPKRNDPICRYEFSWLSVEDWRDYHYRALCNDLASAHLIAHCGISIEKIAA